MSDLFPLKGWCYVCNSYKCLGDNYTRKEKEMICLSCKQLGTTCAACLRARLEKTQKQLTDAVSLMESILKHRDCKDCCGLKLPSLGWYRQIEEVLSTIYNSGR